MPGKVATAIAVDEQGLKAIADEGELVAVAWDEVLKIGILTTDQGPFEDDLLWMFFYRDQDHVLAVPASALDAAPDFFDHLKRFPGLDYDKITEASSSTDFAKFVLWRKHP